MRAFPRFALASVVAVVLSLTAACPAPDAKPPENAPPAPSPTADAGPAAPGAPGAPGAPATVPPVAPVAPPPGPEQPEPEGIAAGAHKIPDAPAGKGAWVVDAAATSVSFTIVSNSAGPITATFPGGAAGALDGKTRKGVFTVDLTKMSSVNKDNVVNPARDTNVIESFFAARPFANAALKDAVAAAWQPLDGKIQGGVARAALVVDSVEGADVKDGATADGVVNGSLLLWESVKVPVSFPVSVSRKGKTVEVTGKGPASFDIEKATGSKLRKLLFDAMIAAGCAHQPGIQNTVTVSLDKVTLTEGAPAKAKGNSVE
jgi:hypothetical protein